MPVGAAYSVTMPLKSSVGLSSSIVVSSESLLPTEWITLELYVEEEDHMVQLTNEKIKLTANICFLFLFFLFIQLFKLLSI